MLWLSKHAGKASPHTLRVPQCDTHINNSYALSVKLIGMVYCTLTLCLF